MTRFRITCILGIFLSLAGLAAPAPAQSFDLESARVQISEVDSAWHFQLGDDPRWSQPGFDDSQWPVLKPTEAWDKQGYPKNTELAWFRFRLRVPPHTDSLVLQLPEIAKSFQLFSDGQLVAQVGLLPPGRTEDVTSAARVLTLPVNSGAAPKELVIALRLWQDPSMFGTRRHRLGGPVYVGSSDPILNQFTNMKAADLLSNGNTYTIDILIFIVGLATVLLFALTRERFYLWFAGYLIFQAAFLPVDQASYHFAWSYHFRTYLTILLDVFSSTAWAFFFVEAVRPGKWKSAVFPAAMVLSGDLAVTLVLTHQITIKWGDIAYFLAETTGQAFLAFYLLRGWRAGNRYARFLFLPFAVEGIASTLNNLGYALSDLGLEPPFNIQPNSLIVLHQPFEVPLSDLCEVISLLGLLAVLVYRFAQTSREEHRLSAALKAAQDIQQRLVPVDVPALGGLRTQIAYRAAEEVGGDFCQILLRPDNSVFVAIGDVSGKGLQAAMLGAVAVGAIRSLASETIGPGAALERLNTVLQTESIGFVTCLCLVLAEDGTMTIANAGHLSLTSMESSFPWKPACRWASSPPSELHPDDRIPAGKGPPHLALRWSRGSPRSQWRALRVRPHRGSQQTLRLRDRRARPPVRPGRRHHRPHARLAQRGLRSGLALPNLLSKSPGP